MRLFYSREIPWLVIIIAIVLLATGSTSARVTTITSLPYTASQQGTNYSDTVVIAGTNLSTTGSGLRVTGHDIVFMFVNDTITFGTNNGDGYYGLNMDNSSYNIKVVGGLVYHGGNGNRNSAMLMMGVNDLLVQGLDLHVAGTNGHCLFTPSIGPPANYNVEFDGGHYTSDVTGYDSRCNYDGAAINIGTTFAGYGDYHYKIHGIRLLTGPSQGMAIGGRVDGNDAFIEVYSCTLQSDARNNTYLNPSGTCLSAANPYQILGSRLAAGSSIHDNVITSGTQYGGSRGIIIETCAGTPENPVRVYNNYVDVHEGPNVEVPPGNVQVLRMRFGNANVHVYDNTFIGTGGIGVGSSYGAQVTVLRITSTDEEGHVPDHGLIIENNIFRANAQTAGVNAIAAAFESFPGRGNIIRNNRFESVGQILAYGESNYGANGVTLVGDTLVRLQPATDPVTATIGWRSYFTASDDTLRDIIYLGGASENDIVIGASGSDYRLQRTLNIKVIGSNGLPVGGTNITVTNAYGRTVGSGLTNEFGKLKPIVSYRFVQAPGDDSLSYNNFVITATRGTDNTQLNMVVQSGSVDPVLTLSNTTGSDPGGDGTNPGDLGDVNANPGTTNGTIDLTWTATGDDGAAGTATSYEIRYSIQPINGTNFPLATLVSGAPTPAPSGAAESFTMTGLALGQLYYIAIKVFDDVGNASNISNVVSSYSAGINAPTTIATDVNPPAGSVTMTSSEVTSYQPIHYQFAVDDNVTFQSALFQNGTVGTGQVTAVVSGLIHQQDYFWKCRAISDNLSDTSEWSSIAYFMVNTQPSAPSVATPATGDTITSAPVTFTANNGSDTDSDVLLYSFYVAADAGFSQVLDSFVNVPEGGSQTATLLSDFFPITGTQYWWRCRAYDGAQFSAYTATAAFVYVNLSASSDCETPPSTPALVSPINGAATGSQTPTLCVTNATPSGTCTDAQSYIYELYYDAALTLPAISPTTVAEGASNTCFTLGSNLPAGRLFWWRARATNGTSSSNWSGPYSFSTPNTAPPTPTLTSPINGDTVSSVAPPFSFHPGSDPDGTSITCFVEVSQTINFASLAASGQVESSGSPVVWIPGDALSNATGYYWRVRSSDNIAYSSYSSTGSFFVLIVGNSPPSAPAAQSPAPSSTVDTTYPILTVLNGVDSDGDELSYQFELYNQTVDTLFGSGYVNEGPSSSSWIVPVQLTNGVTYRWRARSFDGQEFSPWMSLVEFTVTIQIAGNNPPSIPTHLFPSDGAVVGSDPVVLSINNAFDPESDQLWYDFFVFGDSNMTQVIESKFDIPETIGQTFVQLDFIPEEGRSYWWRVRAKDNDNITSPSAPTSFTWSALATGGEDYVSSTIGPDNGQIVKTDRPWLKTQNILAAGNNVYYFEVAEDSLFSVIASASDPITESSKDDTRWHVTDRLEEGRSYFWRVRVNDYTPSPAAKFYVDIDVYASPNPVRMGDQVTFHLPNEPVSLLIQSVSGRTVLLKEGVSGDYVWNMRNNNGNEVSVGVYLWYLTGIDAKGKLMIKP